MRSYLMSHRRCENCGAWATQVHHVNLKRMGGSRRAEVTRGKYMALCLSCHEELHNVGRKK